MTMGIIIQASASSTRLPKKVLYPIGGISVISYLIESLNRLVPKMPIIVATSLEDWDDPIVQYCRKIGVIWYRGPFRNVALRLVQAADANNLDVIVRICGDSPLLDYKLVELAISLFEKGDFDVVTNTHPRSFPIGQSVEIIKKESLRRIIEKLKEPEDQEHVTKYFYKNDHDFKIYNFPNKQDTSHISLALDTQENRTIIERIISKMIKPHWQYRFDDIIEIYFQVT